MEPQTITVSSDEEGNVILTFDQTSYSLDLESAEDLAEKITQMVDEIEEEEEEGGEPQPGDEEEEEDDAVLVDEANKGTP
jgi:hypothetical protein